MSILIRGMEMPKSCEDCPCAYFTEGAHHDYCKAVGYDSEIKYGSEWKLDNCPLVPVPPHGRLIDADALMRHKGDCYDADGHLLYAVGTGNILRVPTIIPAEGERT